jgi:hypothetical protein
VRSAIWELQALRPARRGNHPVEIGGLQRRGKVSMSLPHRRFQFVAGIDFLHPIGVRRLPAWSASSSGLVGVIEAGAPADLVLVEGNPLEDIKLIDDPAKNFVVIMKGGKGNARGSVESNDSRVIHSTTPFSP